MDIDINSILRVYKGKIGYRGSLKSPQVNAELVGKLRGFPLSKREIASDRYVKSIARRVFSDPNAIHVNEGTYPCAYIDKDNTRLLVYYIPADKFSLSGKIEK